MERSSHPIHAILLAGSWPLFLGVLLTDIAYFQTYEVQWKNFASWLLVGALLFCGLALLGALLAPRRAGGRGKSRTIYLLLLLVTWVLGLVNAFVHAGDAWASMPRGLVYAAIDLVLVSGASFLAFFAAPREVLP